MGRRHEPSGFEITVSFVCPYLSINRPLSVLHVSFMCPMNVLSWPLLSLYHSCLPCICHVRVLYVSSCARKCFLCVLCSSFVCPVLVMHVPLTNALSALQVSFDRPSPVPNCTSFVHDASWFTLCVPYVRFICPFFAHCESFVCPLRVLHLSCICELLVIYMSVTCPLVLPRICALHVFYLLLMFMSVLGSHRKTIENTFSDHGKYEEK